MRKLLLALPLALLCFGSCSLERSYETRGYFEELGPRRDGRVRAFARDLSTIQDTIDRHLFNYSPNDPYVNYPTSTLWIEHPFYFMLNLFNRF